MHKSHSRSDLARARAALTYGGGGDLIQNQPQKIHTMECTNPGEFHRCKTETPANNNGKSKAGDICSSATCCPLWNNCHQWVVTRPVRPSLSAARHYGQVAHNEHVQNSESCSVLILSKQDLELVVQEVHIRYDQLLSHHFL